MKSKALRFNFRLALLVVFALFASIPAFSITGTTTFCVGSISALSDTASGGTWSSSSTGTATVDASTGAVTGVAAGTATITHTAASGTYTIGVTVETTATAGSISGTTIVCGGVASTMTASVTGGVWSCTPTSDATIDAATGDVTAVVSGSAIVSYTVTNSCGSVSSTHAITTDVLDAGTISGPTVVCIGSDFAVSNTVSGGTWGSSDLAIVYTDPFSSITGVGRGSAYITYDVNDGVCSATAYYPVTVDSTAYAGIISGPSLICVGATGTLISTEGPGTWSSSTPGVATIDPVTGDFSGASIGETVMTYSLTNMCGSDFAVYNDTIGVAPVVGTITGPSSACTGLTISLSNSATGGVWSSSSTSVATVDAAGIVYANVTGTTVISYTVTTACASAVATKLITVNLTPTVTPITGTATVCVGATTPLSNSTSGGTWSSGSTGLATVSTTGVVTGVSAGTVIISYAVTTACGTVYATAPVTVNPLPNAGTISGAGSVCTGATITLTDAVSGGIWSSSTTAAATVDATGIVTGVAVGSTIISYSVTNSCGTAVATMNVSVILSATPATISGPTSVCAGSTVTVTSSATGGTWSSSATGIATISTTGVITGVSAGAVTISYATTTGCGTAYATYSFTVNPLPNAGTISGASSVCSGLTTTMTNTATGGAWSSTSTSVATISAGGVVTGVAGGTTSILYTVTNTCGTATASQSFTVIQTPSVSVITGPTTVCIGSVVTLSDSVSGGTWTSLAPTLATVDASGNVTGVAVGSVNIAYSIANSCGTALASQTMTVSTTPTIGAISGPSSVCGGSSISLTNATSGGVWTSGSTSVATVGSSTGVVTGVAAGSTVITYTVTNSCGSASTVHTVTGNVIPSAGTITGPASVCPGDSISLSSTVSGGSWSTSATSLATVTGTGMVYGVGAGTVVISYGVNGVCGTGYATSSTIVNPLPFAGSITGPSSVCVGNSMTLIDAVTGGTWGTGSSAIAVVSSTGVVTGVSAGMINIIYSVTNVCGTVIAAHTVTVNAYPDGGTISGATRVCKGALTALSVSVSGGTWGVTNGNATISTGGILTGVAIGIDTVYHSVTNGCGTTTVNYIDTIDGSFPTGFVLGNDTICAGDTFTAAPSVPYGSWTSSNTHAVVLTSGEIIALSAGMDTLRYTVTNSCGTSSATVYLVIRSVEDCGGVMGVTEATVLNPAISVFPNPNHGVFTVNIAAAQQENAVVIVTDLLGRTIKQLNVTTNKETQLQLNAAAGIYFITAQVGNQTISQKIVVE